ncbi:MAG TPA: MerR family transcriptional regulator [Kofleriaceae bacterium]|nr:MerR family transcriptional regulator [Kofleriaceae bacterium]
MQLIKIGELARRSGMPVPTLKHYVREGLISATRKTGKTMSWYDPALVDRLRAIKELQDRQFLPLDVIRESLDRGAAAPDDLAAAEAIAKVLQRHGGGKSRTRAEVLARGGNPRELDWLARMGLAVPSGPELRYAGDDLALLSTLAAARHAGLAAEMLPFSILDRYLSALRALVAAELEMFRAGVFPRARAGEVERLTTVATQLSERLVVLLRRKLLLPTLSRLVEEETDARSPRDRSRPAARRVRKQPGPRGRRTARRSGH